MNDGGPAFPINSAQLDESGAYTVLKPGMSLRDWFAGQAPEPPEEQRISMEKGARENATSAEDGIIDGPKAARIYAHLLSKWRYRFADAMLAEREKGQSDG